MATGVPKSEGDTKILMDRDLAEITAYCDEHLSQVRKSVTQDVETELVLKCQHPQLDANGFCDAQAVLPYLTCMRQAIENLMADDAARFSARSLASALPADYWRALWAYFVAPALGTLAAGEVFLRNRDGFAPYCGKLHHANNKRCIFHHAESRAL
jgi:hypothetical protein